MRGALLVSSPAVSSPEARFEAGSARCPDGWPIGYSDSDGANRSVSHFSVPPAKRKTAGVLKRSEGELHYPS